MVWSSPVQNIGSGSAIAPTRKSTILEAVETVAVSDNQYQLLTVLRKTSEKALKTLYIRMRTISR